MRFLHTLSAPFHTSLKYVRNPLIYFASYIHKIPMLIMLILLPKTVFDLLLSLQSYISQTNYPAFVFFCISLCVLLCTMCVLGSHRGQKRVSNLELQKVSKSPLVFWEPTNALNC